MKIECELCNKPLRKSERRGIADIKFKHITILCKECCISYAIQNDLLNTSGINSFIKEGVCIIEGGYL